MVFVLGPSGVTLSATLDSGIALPAFISFDSSGQLTILATDTDYGSYTVKIMGSLEGVEEFQTIKVEAYQWAEYFDSAQTDPYTLASVETKLVSSEYSLTAMTINRCSYYYNTPYKNWQFGLRLTFTHNTGVGEQQLNFGNFYSHN
jgi:hypothetical protein